MPRGVPRKKRRKNKLNGTDVGPLSRRTKKTEIKSVTVRANVQIAQFQTLHIEAAADVLDGQSPVAVLADLENFVATHLKNATKETDPMSLRPVPNTSAFINRIRG